ncbi:hypothetical protein AAD018_017010 [Aestuariibius insulae]|uniref:hypothetical protein n=1 Tax=Aestuariibius insulae TaxID=2058287 RepID=UPI00398F8B18
MTMIDSFTTSLLGPALILAAMGWMVPRVLGQIFPEGVRPLVWLTLLSAVILFGLSIVAFVVLYLAQDIPIGTLFEPGGIETMVHFSRIAALSGLFWGPVLLLTVSSMPRRWKEAEW